MEFVEDRWKIESDRLDGESTRTALKLFDSCLLLLRPFQTPLLKSAMTRRYARL